MTDRTADIEQPIAPKWTPGPWRTAENENNLAVAPWTDAVGIEAPEDEGGMLAVPSIVAWTTRVGSPEANARLIAAAPELLAACEEAVAEFHKCWYSTKKKLMAAIKKHAGVPFILKGVATAEDAKIAVEHGVEVIYISNHGGRQLDHGRGTIDIVPEVVAAVKGKADVVLDGGVTRGTDVLKALALGCKAVTIGKLQGWGLAAGADAGVVRVLEILEQELTIDMGLLGVTRIDQINASHVCHSYPVTLPHEMSAFSYMPGGQLR